MPLKRCSSLEIAWAAGIYEGEGSCSSVNRCLNIEVNQKDPWILYKLRDLFGGTVKQYNQHANAIKPGNNSFKWYITGSLARGFAYTVFTYLSPRRRAQIREKMGV
jgi:hypothetical protein